MIAVGLGLLALGMATPTAPVVTPGRNGHAGTACPKLTLLGYTPVLRGPSQASGRLPAHLRLPLLMWTADAFGMRMLAECSRCTVDRERANAPPWRTLLSPSKLW